MDDLFNVKYTKMLSFFTGSRGPHGPDLPSPFGRKFQIPSLLETDLNRRRFSERKQSRFDSVANSALFEEFRQAIQFDSS